MSRPTQEELVRDEALIRAALGGLADHFITQLDHNWMMRGYLNQVLRAARTGVVPTATIHGETGIRTTVHDGYIRQSVDGYADTATTTIQVTAPEPADEDEPGPRLYDVPIVATYHDTWTISASSPEEALEIAKERGADGAEMTDMDPEPHIDYGTPTEFNEG